MQCLGRDLLFALNIYVIWAAHTHCAGLGLGGGRAPEKGILIRSLLLGLVEVNLAPPEVVLVGALWDPRRGGFRGAVPRTGALLDLMGAGAPKT